MASPLDMAKLVLGKSEGKDRAALMDYLTTGGANLDPATTAWCAAFVNSSLEQAGMSGTGSNMARSFLEWGNAVKGTPEAGDIAVYPRGDPRGPYGHVGFVESVDPKTGMVSLLAGNQGDAVSVKQYPLDAALGYRRAGEAPPPALAGIGSPSVPQAAPPLPPPYTIADRPIGTPAPEQVAAAPAAPQSPLQRLATGVSKGLGTMATATPAPARSPLPPTPQAARVDAPEMPPIDPQQIERQRQMLAQALMRLNSGRLA